MRDVEKVRLYAESLAEDLGLSIKNINFRINRSQNFFIPYYLRKDGVSLKTLEGYANNLGYRLIFAYDLDQEYIDNLVLFQYYLENEKIIDPINIEQLNKINIIKVGLDPNGIRRLDIFDK